MRRRPWHWAAVWGVFAGAAWAAAACGQEATPAAVGEQLASRETAAVEAGVRGIEELWRIDAAVTAQHLRGGWLARLAEVGRWAEVERWAGRVMVTIPQDAGAVEQALRLRIKARLALQRPGEALGDARVLYEFCGMAGTESACLLVAEGLTRTRPAEATVVNRFMEEQVAAAARVEAGAKEGERGGVLASIAVDRQEYEAALQRMAEVAGANPTQNPELWAKANLLLLAGRPGEALGLFQRLAGTVDYHELTAAREGVARALKALDGGIGRANAYVLELRRGK